MIKKVFISLGLLFFSFTLIGAMDLSTPLLRRWAGHPIKQPAYLAQLIQAASCLYKGRSACQVITWEQAQAFMTQATEQAARRQALIQSYKALRASLPLKSQAKRMDYSLEQEITIFNQAAAYKFIFIGETHLEGIRPAVVRALHTIRKKNPSARILLASEFINTLAPAGALPFQRAGTYNRFFQPPSANYPLVFQAAEKLHMDVLSLDDVWIESPLNGYKEWRFPTKVGNYLVDARADTPQLQELARYVLGPKLSNDPLKIVGTLHDFFFNTSWGIMQRNEQWARYIAALKDSYDIIIVYSGKGHLELDAKLKPVPQLLELTQYAYVELAKVPNSQEQAWVNRITKQRNHNSTGVTLEKEASITYWDVPSINYQVSQAEKSQYKQTITQLQNWEAALGFANVNSLEATIVLPQ